jgi:hypothetical protein
VTILLYVALRQPRVLIRLMSLGLLTREALLPAVDMGFIEARPFTAEQIDGAMLNHDRWRRIGRRVRQVGPRI